MKHLTIEREHHVTDMSVTWTLEWTVFHRRIAFGWHGPVHAYHPETPDHYRRGHNDD